PDALSIGEVLSEIRGAVRGSAPAALARPRAEGASAESAAPRPSPAPSPSSPPSPRVQTAPAPAAPSAPAPADAPTGFGRFLDEVKSRSRILASCLADARLVKAEESRIMVGLPARQKSWRAQLDHPDARKALADAASAAFARPARVEITLLP